MGSCTNSGCDNTPRCNDFMRCTAYRGLNSAKLLGKNLVITLVNKACFVQASHAGL